MATHFFPGTIEVTPIAQPDRTLPADVTPDTWYPVIGYNTERKRVTDQNSSEVKEFDSVSFLIVNNRKKIVRLWESSVAVRNRK
ncbi:MAG TPA: hypothetical protein VLH56_19630 [Dissulfurispiraceae bacterium]|nr:hypothetical protein [Dissulfurispiraceae bacterium]